MINIAASMLLSALLTFSIDASAKGFKIITHKTTKIKKIKRSEISSLFSANQSWPDKSAVTLVVYTYDAPIAKAFNRIYLGKTESQTKKYYLAKVFSGDLPEAPIEVEDFSEMLEMVGDTKGAIGYIPLSKKVNKSVKVIYP